MDVYTNCPTLENQWYLLRMVQSQDAQDLLKVYSDKQAVPLFNSDNCGGDNFYYTTLERMKEAISYWQWEYDRRGFVRWTIWSKPKQEAIGTIEVFHRDAKDVFTNCGLLRVDLRSDFEHYEAIVHLLECFISGLYTLFTCDIVATKAKPKATERIKALKSLGFMPSTEKLIGHDGTLYDSYFVLAKL